MTKYLCVTCGTQYPPSDGPPAGCPICEDDRQYINRAGQMWTTLEERQGQHRNVFEPVAEGLWTVSTTPKLGIGQRAHLLRTGGGNILWDCLAYLDDAAVAQINSLGGLSAIAISHPHFHTTMLDWSHAFGDIPVYVHRDNAPWVVQPGDAVRYWDDAALEIAPGVTLVHCGGHFPGSSVLYWADGEGALFTGDTIYIVADPRWVTFMYSYPNLIPLDAASVRGIASAVRPYEFERLYDPFSLPIEHAAAAIVQRSAERYVQRIGG
ncbi:MAG TPA: MBL fold metallo-hydrolase [Thermomicrobiales bacterium]|nr:MBL fold metallo-hydrolase [Thermomicrobiales bacterium]